MILFQRVFQFCAKCNVHPNAERQFLERLHRVKRGTAAAVAKRRPEDCKCNVELMMVTTRDFVKIFLGSIYYTVNCYYF